MKILKPFLCFLQAILIALSSFSVYAPGLKTLADHMKADMDFSRDFSFEALSGDEAKISDAEKKLCRDWFNENLLTDKTPAYDFTVDGKRLKENIADWDISVGSESEPGAVRPGGKTVVITLNHKKSDITAAVEATIYEDFATCDWTVYIQNAGNGDSPMIEDFCAADCDMKSGTAELYCLYGSNNKKDDFSLRKTALSEEAAVFNATAGRNSSWLPYFNVDGDSFGFVTAIGWTGQWYSSFAPNPFGVHYQAKQEYFRAFLHPGEKVRSPLVSLSFYETGKPAKGYNIYRSFSNASVINENVGQRVYQCASGPVEDVRATVDAINASGVSEYIDTFWFDAEKWFYKNALSSWRNSAGDWTARKDWYPNGFVEVSDMLKENGIDTMLWFEPERVRKGTLFYEVCSEKGWLISKGSLNHLLNLANDECCNWYIDYMVTFFKENHIAELRQDFNIDPLPYWNKNDEKDRSGITENHYVTNLYRYLDTMLSSIEGLRIDNCSSGGRRIDCEMMRRSVPLWRSDYQCVKHGDAGEAAQVQSYGLSLVLPYSCIDYEWADSEYEYLSCITPIREVHFELAIDNPEKCVNHLRRYNSVKSYLIENYYPLTPAASTNAKTWIAMQYGTGEAGLVLAYRHGKAEETLTVKLCEVDTNADYILSFPFDDTAESIRVSGRTLAEGFVIQSSAAPEGIIIEYAKQ